MINILVADDHALIRQGVRQVLALDPSLHFVAEAKNAWEVIECIRSTEIDLVLLDMGMPGPSGIELIKRIKSEKPRPPVLVLSMHADWQIAARAIKAGASGYVTKDSDAGVLIEAIKLVSKGENFIDPALATRMVFNARSTDEVPHEALSDREFQVFLALVQGRSLIDIAEELHLSAKTISTHKFRLMQKLGIESMSELVRYAMKHEFIT